MNDTLRILRITDKLYPEFLGGIELHAHYMSQIQAEMGHEVVVLTSDRGNGDLPREEQRDGYRIKRYKERTNLFGNTIVPGLGKSLHELTSEFDVVHAHSHLTFTTNLATIANKFSETPLAITNHGLYSQTAPKLVQKLYLGTVGEWTLNSADLVFCYTKEAKAQARDHDITADVEIVSNGIDRNRFTPTGERYDKINDDRTVVLSVVRLVEGKRPKDIIEAIEIVKESHPDVKLYLCGDGYLRDELEEYVQAEEIENHVTFLGNVDYEDMSSVYRSCDMVVLPSEAEAGCPRVILEAMATKKPFVMSDLEQNSSVLKEVGLTAPVGNVEQVANQIERLVSDKDLRNQIGKKGRRLIETEYNWQKTTEETTAALEQLVSEQNGVKE